MSREQDLEHLYRGLAVFARRARELSSELHPGLSLVAFTILDYIETRPSARGADIAMAWGIDKSTVSRQINELTNAGLLARTGERPGRRGQQLELTAAGSASVRAAAQSIRALLSHQFLSWTDADITEFERLIAQFNGPARGLSSGSAQTVASAE